MSQIRRINVVSRHMVGNFNFNERPTGIDKYRANVLQFDPKEFRQVFLQPQADVIESVLKAIDEDPLFDLKEEISLNREEMRGKAVERIISIWPKFAINRQQDWENPLHKVSFTRAMGYYDTATSVRWLVHMVLYLDTIDYLGTEKHFEFINRAYTLSDYGCYCMTELGHGSNVSSVETVATYDPSTREFILNSPTPTAAKWWVGALANTANKAVVFSQLIIGDTNYGVHAFLIDIRNRDTFDPLPGCIIGDCGPKNGLHAIDNGFMILDNYRAPYDALLDRFSSISPDGKFKSPIKNNEKRFAVMLMGMTRGRIGSTVGSNMNMQRALTAAIRFSAVRQQFVVSGSEESHILDYQIQRYRLMPHFAKMFASTFVTQNLLQFYEHTRPIIHRDPESSEGADLHAFLSVQKCVASFYSRDCVKECREATGGFGYSSYSQIGALKKDNDVHLTWEGDSNVLLQQSARYITKQYQQILKGKEIDSKLLKEFLDFDITQIPKVKANFTKSFDLTEEALYQAMVYRFQYSLFIALRQLQENTKKYEQAGEAWNRSIVFGMKDLSIAFIELLMAQAVMQRQKESVRSKDVFKIIGRLFMLEAIDKNSSRLMEGYLNFEQLKLVRKELLISCNQLANGSIKILDAIDVPMKILGSVLSGGDGKMYERFTQALESERGVYDQPFWIESYLIARNSRPIN